ncbi:hypothetical protein GP486_002240 [Trichoglossum hirsutum]|uniref:ATP-grasp domain-containing protein n=1 Tax=Trichoglossum hirsutum TaxID=265104 RepID=A0A9P8RRV9_9PEZI|nr:hypothetical protein GP486_002240 [Trichoglossum hirsutum]
MVFASHASPEVCIDHFTSGIYCIDGVAYLPGELGYQDSGADIGYVLRTQSKVDVLTPSPNADPDKDTDWCFPDSETGILAAITKGATHLWANTILFASHPLQISPCLNDYQDKVLVVGQPPLLVEKFDDKEYTNNLLRLKGSFTMPRTWTIRQTDDMEAFFVKNGVPYPIVGKPIRGRGSHGVKVCFSKEEIVQHVQQLFNESPIVMLEEYLSGEEATITVMPPSPEKPYYWSMPIVVRFNHQEGIAPYSGVVAVTANSKALTPQEVEKDVRYGEAIRECEAVAEILQVTAPIRIDIRRFSENPGSKFALFDINMKPNMTGPGRPSRKSQASLTAIAASMLGWDYPMLLHNILKTASPLAHLRQLEPKI